MALYIPSLELCYPRLSCKHNGQLLQKHYLAFHMSQAVATTIHVSTSLASSPARHLST